MTIEPSGPPEDIPAQQPEGDAGGPAAPGGGYPDPSGFEDGDGIDSAAVVEPDDGYQQPANPDAEPVDQPGDDEPGEDA